jgi:hypothetical protein
MHGIKTIWNKEFARIFKDKKMVFSVFFLPVIIMIGIMSIMNYMGNNMNNAIEQHRSIVYVENVSEKFMNFVESINLNMEISVIDEAAKRQEVEEQIRNGEADLIVEFPAQFDELVIDYQMGDAVPQVKTFFNPSESYSSEAQYVIDDILEDYRQELLIERIGDINNVAIFTVNTDNPEMVMQDEGRAMGQALGSMLPYFITLLLFAGAMGIGTDMIAGEKERGTMASLLMAPIKRSSIALGKVFALMALSGLSSAISVIGLIVFMPIMNGSGGADAMKASLLPSQIIMLGGMIVAMSFLYSTLIALLSVFAKDIKEASSYIMPVYMVVMVTGVMTMFTVGEPSQGVFFIPIYNAAVVLGGILSQDVTVGQYLITLGMTVGISVGLIGVIVKAFNSEKIMSS